MSTCSLVILITTLSASPVAANPNGELLEFTAKWCGACQRMDPMVMQLQRKGWPIRKIDVDKNPELAKKFKIDLMPSFVLVINGKPLLNEKIVGGTDSATLRALMNRIPRKVAAKKKKNVSVVNVSQGDTSGKKRFNFPWGGKKKKASSQQIIIEHEKNQPEVAKGAEQQSPSKQQAPTKEEILQRQRKAFYSTVRLNIKDTGGTKYGTGTIIERRDGFLVVLTCGHVLRDVKKSVIKVDLFTPEGTKTVTGKLIQFDMESDVGLVSVKTDLEMPVVKIASLQNAASKGEPLFSIGCGGGKNPTVEEHSVTAINRYLGPDNVECSKTPAVGRSGGGLFNNSGEIVGICSAADRKEKRGIYAGLKPIHQMLNQVQLSSLISDTETKLASVELPNEGIQSDFEIEAEDGIKIEEKESSQDSIQDISELVKMAGKNAEIVCIIRPANQPESEGRVIVINKASKKLMEYLTGDVSDKKSKVTVGKTTVNRQSLKPVLNISSGKRWDLKKDKRQNLTSTIKFVKKH